MNSSFWTSRNKSTKIIWWSWSAKSIRTYFIKITSR